MDFWVQVCLKIKLFFVKNCESLSDYFGLQVETEYKIVKAFVNKSKKIFTYYYLLKEMR